MNDVSARPFDCRVCACLRFRKPAHTRQESEVLGECEVRMRRPEKPPTRHADSRENFALELHACEGSTGCSREITKLSAEAGLAGLKMAAGQGSGAPPEVFEK